MRRCGVKGARMVHSKRSRRCRSRRSSVTEANQLVSIGKWGERETGSFARPQLAAGGGWRGVGPREERGAVRRRKDARSARSEG